jgi:hypothetical protein
MNKGLQFLIYNTPRENVKIDVVVKDETIWLTQKAMASLFDVQRQAITKHLKNIFEEVELDEKVVSSKMELTTQHGAIEGKMLRTVVFSNLMLRKPRIIYLKKRSGAWKELLPDISTISKT